MDVAAPLSSTGLSFFRLVENADPVVQGVLLALALASILCWTISFEKILRYAAFYRQVRHVERITAGGHSRTPGELPGRFQLLIEQENREPDEGAATFQERIERSLGMEISTHLRRLQSGLPILATVGSTAPFVGLFGTVWGIMNSFTGIAAAKDTSLAVVAPGIAEALLATAIGLAAAIPAVIFYNLANVFLSDCSERLSIAASKYAKGLAFGIRTETPAEPSSNNLFDRELRALTNGGIDAR
jgi:biopolymer transport protein ExbB/TolQ